MILDDDGIELLDEPACRSLLARTRFGRVGVTVGALPVIVPVNYIVDGDDVVFATRTGTKLRAAVRQAIVAFQIDAVDEHARAGWSVLAIGPCEEVTEPEEREALLGRLDPFARWRDHVVRMHPDLLSGRRIAPPVAAVAD